jgi:hypothetical protein
MDQLSLKKFPDLFSTDYNQHDAAEESLSNNLDAKNPIFNLLHPVIETAVYKLRPEKSDLLVANKDSLKQMTPRSHTILP